MITVTQEPGSICFARNPTIYGLHTDNLYPNVGQKTIALLGFPDYTNGGDGLFDAAPYSFALIYGGNTLTFIVSNDDPDSGYNLPSGYSLSFDDWIALVLTRLQGNYFLKRDFNLDIYATGGTKYIRFSAKYPGTAYNLSTDTANQITETGHAMAVFNQLTAGTDKTARPNFKIMIEVWMWLPDGSDAERLSQAFADVDEDGNCVYDISGTLTDGLSAYGFDRPSLAMPAAEICPNTSRRYYLQVAEVYGDQQVIRAVTATTTKMALYGSFSKRMVEQLLFPDYFITGEIVKFLDQELSVKQTRIKQPEFLTFCNFIAPDTAVSMRVVVTFTDNTTDQIADPYSFVDVPLYQKLYFPAGYSQLNLGLLNPAKTVASWTVTLVNGGGTALTETKTYVMDYTYRPYGRYLLYQNSFGGYISNFTYGKASLEYELTLKSSDITPVGGFKLINGEQINFDQLSTDKISLVTGFTSRRSLLVYRDFILSVDKFLVDKGVALPIGILSDSIKLYKDGDNLYSQTFDITFLYAEEVYTYDPEEDEPFSPGDLGNYVPPNPDDMPDNFDDRYYLKTLTYNRVEIDGKITTETNARIAGDENLQAQIDELTAVVASKMDADATFDDRYYTKDQINAFLGSADPLDYVLGVPNPIRITDFQTDYPNFGNAPAIMVFEVVSDTDYKLRTDIEPELLFVDGALDTIVIDSQADDDGNTMAALRIIIKAT